MPEKAASKFFSSLKHVYYNTKVLFMFPLRLARCMRVLSLTAGQAQHDHSLPGVGDHVLQLLRPLAVAAQCQTAAQLQHALTLRCSTTRTAAWTTASTFILSRSWARWPTCPVRRSSLPWFHSLCRQRAVGLHRRVDWPLPHTGRLHGHFCHQHLLHFLRQDDDRHCGLPGLARGAAITRGRCFRASSTACPSAGTRSTFSRRSCSRPSSAALRLACSPRSGALPPSWASPSLARCACWRVNACHSRAQLSAGNPALALILCGSTMLFGGLITLTLPNITGKNMD